MRIIVGITSPGSTPLISGQLSWFQGQGHEVFLACPEDESVARFCREEGVRHLPVDMARDIRPWQDLLSLIQLFQIFRKVRPDVINVGTPKMGVLGSLAGFLARVPNRIYTCRGFRYEHEKGARKRLLIWMERLAGRCAHRIICISDSVRKKGIEDRVFKPSKTRLIPPGSSNGIDVSRFNAKNVDQAFARKLSKELSLDGKFVIGFVGRLIDRKGILELYEAYCRVRKAHSDVTLVLVGSKFDDQLSTPWLMEAIEADPDIHWIGFQEDVVTCLSVFDLFVLPAWWEGFGNVLVQAAAMGLPVLSTDVTGCKDAVSHGFNGILVQRGNIDQLERQIVDYMLSPQLRRKHGNNGIEWASRFEPEKIWAGLEEVYMEEGAAIQPLPQDGDQANRTKVLFIATSDIHLHVFHRPHIEWLCSNGYQVDIAAETRRGYRIGANGVWHELKFARELTSFSHLATLRKLRRVIRHGSYDLISCHTPIPGALARLAVAGVPQKRPRVVYMAHGFHFSKKGSLLNWLVYYPAEVALSRLTDALVVINHEDLEHARSPRFLSKSYLVPGIGVDIERFRPLSQEQRGQIRRELGFSQDDFIIQYIGEFIQRKNHKFIVNWAQDLSKRCPNVKIVFVGKGRLGNRLKRAVKRRGLQKTFVFAGFREDVERYAAVSDVGISSSRREGLGLGLAEQMACGLPAVASCDKGHRELVEEGVNGFLFQQGDRASFINAVRKLHDDPKLRQRMGKESRIKALNFSIEASVEAMGKVYRTTLNQDAQAEPSQSLTEMERDK